MKVAVIGAGIAGMGAAWTLAKEGLSVTLFEQDDEIGGDAYVVPVHSWDGTKHWVDGGVSDFNRSTFTNFASFLKDLEVSTRRIQRECGFMTSKQRPCYFMTDAGQLSFQKTWQHSPVFERDIAEFRDEVTKVLTDPSLKDLTVGAYFRAFPRSEEFKRFYFYPRALGCFAMHEGPVDEYPMRALASFWNMHAIIGKNPSERMCLPGGMAAYLERFSAWLKDHGGQQRRRSRVVSLRGCADALEIVSEEKGERPRHESFDAAIVAVKPNHVKDLILNQSAARDALYQAFSFRRDRVVVHNDDKLLPRSKRAWGAFNLTVPDGSSQLVGRTTITFWVNRLALLDKRLPDIFITLNPPIEPDPAKVIQERSMIHPVASFASLEAIDGIAALQGRDRIWYAGSYLELPYLHENALNTGIRAAESVIAAKL